MTTHTWYSETVPRSLRQSLGENWLLFLLRGLAAILFGALSLVWPGLSLLTLILLYAAYAVVDGVFALVAGILGTGSAVPRWWLIIIGLLGIAAGIVTFMWPGLTALVLLFFIAGWAICTGLLQIVGAIQLRKEIEDEWWLILDGLLSVVVGIAMLVLPGAGALALVWLIGLYAIMAGVLMVGFAFTVRKYRSAAV